MLGCESTDQWGVHGHEQDNRLDDRSGIADAGYRLRTGGGWHHIRRRRGRGSPGCDSGTQQLSIVQPCTGRAGSRGGLKVTTIPLGGGQSGVEAKLPINGYYAGPGREITFDASKSEGAIDRYEWDLDGDGTYDQITTSPILKHTYVNEFDGEMILRVSDPFGGTNILKTPVHISSTPFQQQLAPPQNVKAEVISTEAGISEVKVTWESDDPQANTWAVAVDGFPVGRIEKSARSVTVTDIRRGKDVLLEIFGITADMNVGERAGTTLPAAG
jgi:hypothetical protein